MHDRRISVILVTLALGAILLPLSACGGGGGGDSPWVPTDPGPERFVFITSNTYIATEVVSADFLCQNSAANNPRIALKGRSWMAWFSFNNTANPAEGDAISRVKARVGQGAQEPWRQLSPSKEVVFADISNLAYGPKTGIRYDEIGNEIGAQASAVVWTGTLTSGKTGPATQLCPNPATFASWQSSSGNSLGIVGLVGGTNDSWTNAKTISCDQRARLLCLQM